MVDGDNDNDAEVTATTTNAFDPVLSQANLSATPDATTLVTLPNGTKIYTVTTMNTSTVSDGKDYDKQLCARLSVGGPELNSMIFSNPFFF